MKGRCFTGCYGWLETLTNKSPCSTCRMSVIDMEYVASLSTAIQVDPHWKTMNTREEQEKLQPILRSAQKWTRTEINNSFSQTKRTMYSSLTYSATIFGWMVMQWFRVRAMPIPRSFLQRLPWLQMVSIPLWLLMTPTSLFYCSVTGTHLWLISTYGQNARKHKRHHWS